MLIVNRIHFFLIKSNTHIARIHGNTYSYIFFKFFIRFYYKYKIKYVPLNSTQVVNVNNIYLSTLSTLLKYFILVTFFTFYLSFKVS